MVAPTIDTLTDDGTSGVAIAIDAGVTFTGIENLTRLRTMA